MEGEVEAGLSAPDGETIETFLEGEVEAGPPVADVGHIEMPEEYVGRDPGADPLPPTEENPFLQRFIPDPWAEPTVGESLPNFPAPSEHEAPDWIIGGMDEHLASEMEDAAAITKALDERRAWDSLEDSAEDIGEAVADFVKNVPLIGDALGDVGDVLEDVVDHLDQPVVDPDSFVLDTLGEEPKEASAEQVEFVRDILVKETETQADIMEFHKQFGTDLHHDLMKQVYEEQMEDALGDMAEDIGEAITDSVRNVPIIGDALGDSLEKAGDVVEDVLDRMNDPDPIDPWEASPEDSLQRDPITGEPVDIDIEALGGAVKDMGEAVVDSVKNLFVGEDEGAVDDMNDPAVEDVVDPWG